MPARTLDEMQPEELATMNAQQLVDALGGVSQGQVAQNGFYTKEFKALVDAQPKLPLLIPTPDNWRAPFPYFVEMIVNDMTLRVEGDALTMVPQVFYEDWQNHVQGEANHRRQRSAGLKNLNMPKADMPTWGEG